MDRGNGSTESLGEPSAKKQRRETPEAKARKKATGDANREINEGLRLRDCGRCSKALLAAFEGGFKVPASAVAGVLHVFEHNQRYQEGVDFYQQRIAGKYKEWSHERISTVLLRLQCHCVDDLTQLKTLVEDLANKLHSTGTLKRRLFTEPLKQFSTTAVENFAKGNGQSASAALATESMLKIVQKYGIELWDEDFLNIAITFRAGAAAPSIALGTLCELLIDYHPVVGSRLAGQLSAAFRNVKQVENAEIGELSHSVDIKDDGICPNCRVKLDAFEFDKSDREKLLDDIEQRLVVPNIRFFNKNGTHRGSKSAVGAMDNVTPPTAEEVQCFTDFKARMGEACLLPLPQGFDHLAILDGANIGYYNVSAWYSSAKKEVLKSKGMDLASVPPHELDHSSRRGTFMDVPLNFESIDAAVAKAVERRWFPIIVLHERHLQAKHLTPTNKYFLDKWNSLAPTRGNRPLVIVSPAALNDDFAWLYASVCHRCYVITNDLCRDHHYGTLSRRSFLRWRGRFRVPFRCWWPSTYSFGVDSGAPSQLRFTLSDPPQYSVWMQQNKRTDPTTKVTISMWHIPFHEHLPIVDQSTNEAKTEEQIEKAAAEAESIKWICTAR